MNFKKRKYVPYLAALIGAAVLTLSTAPVLAVHDQDFELEGNVANDGADVPGTQDWVNLFDISGGVATPKTANSTPPLPTNFGPVSFVRDFKLNTNGSFNNGDDTTFATGSKDTLNPTGGWQCAKSNNVLNQDDLMNVYAGAFSDPVTGELKLYFGAERNGNNGTKNIGFWFLQDSTVNCVAGQGNTDFTGNHVDGDLFIVSEFSNGGVVSSIKVFKWEGGANGVLNPTPIATGVDCKNVAANDDVCATENGTTPFTPPWLTQTDQPGNTQSTEIQSFEFFEGGLSLTNLNLSACFTRFLVNTRSSDSLTATIFDYALGNFALCGIGVNKVCTTPTVENPNPIVDPADDASFLTRFDITISKSGPAGVFDPTVEEDSTFAQGESCMIIAITGGATNPPALPVLNFHNGNPVQVSDTLGVTPITVQIECDTFSNGFINSVTARAATSDGGAKDITASDTMTQAQACSATVNPLLSVNKICHDETAIHTVSADVDILASHPADPKATSLVYENGNFAGFGVDVFVELKNTGNIDLKNIVLSDTEVVSFTPVTISQGSTTHTVTTFDGTLDKGEKAYFKANYLAPAPDNNATDPSTANFTDTVTVTGEDVLGTDLEPVPVDSAVCPLCPD